MNDARIIEKLEQLFDAKLPIRYVTFLESGEYKDYDRHVLTGDVHGYLDDCLFYVKFDDVEFINKVKKIKDEGVLSSLSDKIVDKYIPLSPLFMIEVSIEDFTEDGFETLAEFIDDFDDYDTFLEEFVCPEPEFLVFDSSDPKCPIFLWDHEDGLFHLLSQSLDDFLNRLQKSTELG